MTGMAGRRVCESVPLKALLLVFAFLVAGNAVVFALIWLEQDLAAMDRPPESQSHPVPAFGGECVALGPLQGHEGAEALAEQIRRDGGRAVVQGRDILSRPDYVVHVEPSASRDLAMQALRELKNRRINGHVISDGKLANAVSVGVFGLPAPAEVRRQHVAELGYDVDIARLERRRTVYSVYADGPPLHVPNGMRLAPCGER